MHITAVGGAAAELRRSVGAGVREHSQEKEFYIGHIYEQRTVHPLDRSFEKRPDLTSCRNRAWVLSLCRGALVQHHLRARWHYHGHANLVGCSGNREGSAVVPGCKSGQQVRSLPRRRARKDTA